MGYFFRLENCSLKHTDINIIAKIIAESMMITDLSVNENPIPEMNYNILLQGSR